MGGEKDGSGSGSGSGSRSRGGFFQLFDWTAKSRKKLFSSNCKLELPERGKKSHPMATRLNLADSDDIGAGSNMSCASDEEGYGGRAPGPGPGPGPGVVARLMGLDSLPDDTLSQSLDDVPQHYRHYERNLDPQRIIIEKFQTEMLPPKSAKPIHHKLLSPIKSRRYVPAKSAAHIMEAAARIIEAGAHAPPVKGPVIRQKEKVEATQIQAQATQKQRMIRAPLKGRSPWTVKEQPFVKPSPQATKNKAKSISLAIQAKVNVQKREGLHTNGSTFKSVGSTQPLRKSVLRQNNQKQNSKPQGRKVDHSCGRSIKSTRKLGLGEVDNQKEVLCSGINNQSRKKRSIHKSQKPTQSDLVIDRRKGMDVVSFTFTAPLTRAGSEATATCQGKRHSISSLGYNVIGGDALSMLLEQKLKELSYGVECSRLPDLNMPTPTPRLDYQHARHTDKLSGQYSSTEPMQNFQFEGANTMDVRISNDMDARDFRHTSPVSVLDYSDSVDSDSTQGSKPTIEAQKLHSADTELSDSASSTTLTLTLMGSEEYELDYVNGILRNVDLMFKDFVLGRAESIINPQLFNDVENGEEGSLERKLLFDCVRECMEARYGGCKAWIKGAEMVKRKKWLAEQVYKEIKGWRGIGDSMVDEIVEKDMSTQYGTWLPPNMELDAFQVGSQIEAQIFNCLLEELFADVLSL